MYSFVESKIEKVRKRLDYYKIPYSESRKSRLHYFDFYDNLKNFYRIRFELNIESIAYNSKIILFRFTERLFTQYNKGYIIIAESIVSYFIRQFNKFIKNNRISFTTE